MATRTIANSGGNWSDTGTWVEGQVPTSSDAVVATSSSGQLTVDVTTAVCASIILTNYVNTMTFTVGQTLTVSGNVTFVSGMALSGTGFLVVNATATLTSGGLLFPGSLNLTGANTFTLGDNWSVAGNFINGPGAATINNNQITCNASCNIGGSITGTTNFILAGTGTWGTGGAACTNNFTINTSGTITVITNAVITYKTGTITYVAGTVVVLGTLSITGSCTLNTASINWNVISSTNAGTTITLGGNLNTNTLLLSGQNGTMTFSGAFNISCNFFQQSATINLVVPSLQTLTINTRMIVANDGSGIFTSPSISSGTPSSSMFLNYKGTIFNNMIFMTSFTDVDASGSAQPILNYFGGNPYGTLLRTVNITNQNITAPSPVFTAASTGIF